jgi:hypothetical protein
MLGFDVKFLKVYNWNMVNIVKKKFYFQKLQIYKINTVCLFKIVKFKIVKNFPFVDKAVI